MALSNDARIDAAADNRLLTRGAKIGGAFGVPLIIGALFWTGATMIDLRDRVGALETTVRLTTPEIYPRGEAAATIGTVNARLDGAMNDIRSNTHRISALEAARERLH